MMSTAKLDELVKTMNSAEGAAKTEAMAGLLTALVRDRRACER
jgi:chromosome condensin MukBEF ATPase and DNA-binding subunit MukB